MSDPGSSEARRAWVATVLGVVLPPPGVATPLTAGAAKAVPPVHPAKPPPPAPPVASGVTASGKTVSVTPPDPDAAITKAAQKPELWTQKVGSALQGPPTRPPEPIASALPTGKKASFVGRNGKKLEVVTGEDGRVAFTADPPPLREVTFSGGGGKGAALPGAVKALEETGALKEVSTFHGASVGSMTAAILAAGISADGFATLANDTKMGPMVKAGSVLPINVDGTALESWVRDNVAKSVRGQIAAFLEKAGPGLDKETLATVQAIDGKLSRGGGVTFGDLRTLSKLTPDIKELVVSGTMMGDDSAKPGTIAKGKPQLAIFSADTEPDLDVALAVHASAALPPVFKPVNIKLSSGITASFEDGGVMNNAPTSDLVGAERSLDPVPDDGKMTFVFEEDASEQVLKGEAVPSHSMIGDLVAKAPLSATEYAKNRGLADRPGDVVMVPLKFKGPWYKRTDFSGFIGGTINFDIPKDARVKLQSMTEDATLAHLKNRKMPETREYASAGQMLSSVGRGDLEAMVGADFPGAKDELAFRDAVADGIKALEGIAAGAKAAALKQGPVKDALTRLNDLAKGGRDRLAFIGRELNRSGRLDPLLDLAKRSGAHDVPALEAGVAVADALAAKGHAQTVLRDVIYPKMVTENPKGVGGTVLRQVDNKLRAVATPQDFNAALTIAIKHFEHKSDFASRHHHHAFAAELKTYLMPAT